VQLFHSMAFALNNIVFAYRGSYIIYMAIFFQHNVTCHIRTYYNLQRQLENSS
jgi:hypothetical protein